MRDTPGPKAWTGILLADLRFPGARTLKERRGDLVSIRDRLRGLGFSVAQTGPSDLPGRAWLAASFTAGSPGAVESLLARAESIMLEGYVEVGSIETGVCLFEPSREEDS